MLAVLALLFRGRSTGLRDLASCAVPAVIPVCVLTFAALVFVNRRWDSGPRTRVDGTVYPYNAKGHTQLAGQLLDKVVALDRPADGLPWKAQPATFVVGPGALGARWIADVEIP